MSNNITMLYFLAVLILIAANSCSETPERPFDGSKVTSKLTPAQTKELTHVVSNYLDLKTALAQTDAIRVHATAENLSKNARNLKDDIRQAAADSIASFFVANTLQRLEAISKDAAKIADMVDATCEQQRIPFGPISDDVYILLKQSEAKNLNIYHINCPMAYNEKGAWWLSNSTQIRNPYFGKKMETCGQVVDTLK
ncbi:MAG: DUF3347 domain-containing protein [Edaphocola sp.]